MGATVLQLTALSPAAIDEIKTCSCECCADARERIRCGAFLAYACNCAPPAVDRDGRPIPPCDCVFCAEQVASPPERVQYVLDTN